MPIVLAAYGWVNSSGLPIELMRTQYDGLKDNKKRQDVGNLVASHQKH